MKRTLLLVLIACLHLGISAQPKIAEKKYQSLLWEITGNGLKKPSYLIGTMHVSSKLAFHLPDSFYLALKSAQVVALETNPETWQEDMSKYDLDGGGYLSKYGGYGSVPNQYLTINTLKFYEYDKKIERALYSNPSTINNLLYRTYGNESSDFEEDTYLDMYIFQCGKKWGKKVTGVENYGESMKLMSEAYKDAAKDKNKKEKSYEGQQDYSGDKIQEAYRSGNLDLLDSINRYNSFSAAFDEKFLYRRNEIQAGSIDSIIKSGASLFVGVGAAHLPGTRGVIELLRKKGYKLRPVKMGERDSRDKEQVDKIRVPVIFKTETPDDGLFKVDIPGKFYKYGEGLSLDERQYADMANGSYYMVTRVLTNAWMWGHNPEQVYKKIDSLLYENIPGKIITKTTIVKNGYKGFDITNRTRRGDVQRYNIFITPFEIIFFKMSGNNDYVREGEEARKFFGSIQFKEYKAGTEWKKYSPPYGGFVVDLPHDPYIGNDGSWIFDAEDKAGGGHYRVMRSDIHNYRFVEEDTFDLGLLDESFAASEFIDTQLARQQSHYKGYPSLDSKYKDKNGGIYLTRFIIQGPHYYTLMAYGKQETNAMKNFLNSFDIKPIVYHDAKQRTDTSLYYTVTTPVFPEDKKIKLDMSPYQYGDEADDDDMPANDLGSGTFRSKTISNDTTGEKISVSFFQTSRYFSSDDSLLMEERNVNYLGNDTTLITRYSKKTTLPNKMKVWETIISDTGSSRTLWSKSFYRDGVGFALVTESDTLTPPSSFVKKFYETFTPVDTLKGSNPFAKKSALFFSDFMSSDSSLHKRAIKNIDVLRVDSVDLPAIKKAIAYLNWNEKKYLDTKKSLIAKVGQISTRSSADYLKELYYAQEDTVQLQYLTLENLLQQKTSWAYNNFRDIINTEPPVLDVNSSTGSAYDYSDNDYMRVRSGSYDNDSFLDELTDSLQLTRTILPDLLPLLNLDDYKSSMMHLLADMVDSNLVKPKDYDIYFSKFLIEAKQELRKQSLAEKNKAIEKAEESKNKKTDNLPDYSDDEKDSGNDDLSLYATLLLPFWETKPAVEPLILQMLRSNDKELKYSTMLLLLKHNRNFNDTLLNYFAGMDEYRYKLYKDLKTEKKLSKFPSAHNNHLDLGKSALVNSRTYDQPDSIVYLNHLPIEYKNKKGSIYFYKYKGKKDDLFWKLGVVGIVPNNPLEFEFTDSSSDTYQHKSRFFESGYQFNRYNFTELTDTKLAEDEPIEGQLKKALKKLLYARRNSAKDFYQDDSERSDASDNDY